MVIIPIILLLLMLLLVSSMLYCTLQGDTQIPTMPYEEEVEYLSKQGLTEDEARNIANYPGSAI